MARITQSTDLFFPVTTQPIFTHCPRDGQKPATKIKDKKAVINDRTGEVLGIVGKDYSLITNEEARHYARVCARQVFRETKEDEWELLAVDAPPSARYCHLDLVHNTAKLDFAYLMVGTREGVPDTYGPFVRVTNSYNGRRALRFTIGCYRKTCSNGLTARRNIISFSFAHARKDIGTRIAFKVDHDRVRAMQQEFRSAFRILQKYRIDKGDGRRLVHAILAIRKPKDLMRKRPAGAGTHRRAAWRDWLCLEDHVEQLYQGYSLHLGDNAYSALQAATDLASRPLDNACLRRDRNSLQRLAGEWMIDFRRQCRKGSFDLSEYLGRPTHAHEKHAAAGRL